MASVATAALLHRETHKERPTGKHVPKGNSQGLDVGTRINRQVLHTGELLCTSKSRSANEACLGLLDARFCLRPHYFRDPIINQLYRRRPAGVGFEHDVGWLDVAMHYAARFRGSQCARGLLNYFQGECERHWPITAHTGL